MAKGSLTDVLTPDAANALQDFNDHVGNQEVWRLRGGVAIRYWTATDRSRASELDTATASLYDVPPTRGSKFDAVHWHRPNTRGQHYGALVHSATITKVDVFALQPNAPPAEMVALGAGNLTLPVEGPNALFVTALRWLIRHVTTEYGFGPHDKRIQAVTSLADVVDWGRVEDLWQEQATNQAEIAAGAANAMYWAVRVARQQRGARTSTLRHVLGQITGYCRGCDRYDARYPIVPPRVIAWRTLRRRIGQTGVRR